MVILGLFCLAKCLTFVSLLSRIIVNDQSENCDGHHFFVLYTPQLFHVSPLFYLIFIEYFKAV